MCGCIMFDDTQRRGRTLEEDASVTSGQLREGRHRAAASDGIKDTNLKGWSTSLRSLFVFYERTCWECLDRELVGLPVCGR